MKILPTWPLLLAALVAGAALGAGLQQIRVANARSTLAETKQKNAEVLVDLAKKTSDARAKILASIKNKQDELAALDSKYQGNIANASKINAELRADVRAGTRRLRVIGAYCQPSTPAVPATSAASSVGTGDPELDPTVRENILNLKQEIEKVTNQVCYLQEYAASCRN